jgi:hypothetical protein
MTRDIQLPDEGSKAITVRLGDVGNLFNAPDINPFSQREVDILGESGLSLIIDRILAWRLRSRSINQLSLLLPPDKITPGLEVEIAAALRRYTHAKIDNNRVQIRSILIEAMTQLMAVIIVVAILAAGLIMLINRGIVSTSTPAGLLLAFSLSVLAWVTLWDPVESLAFDWIPPYRENRVLRAITAIRIVVMPDDGETLP